MNDRDGNMMALLMSVFSGTTTMNNKHSVFEALGAMSLLVAVGTVAMLLFR